MKYISVAAMGVSLFICSGVCSAYEPGTHQRLSNAAALDSVLVEKSPATNTSILEDLGLKGYADNTQQFPDSQVGESIYLDPDKQALFKAASSSDIQYLIQAGAALEDEGFRALCHFYDPLPGHTAPLSALGFVASYSAPEWATGYADSGALVDGDCQFGPVGSSPQLYSLKNAEGYFYKALTLPSESNRNQQFGNLFLSLGHVMHLLQDTSVPQHVRDDMHCDDPLCKFIFLYHPSKYEAYTYYSAPIGSSTYGSVIFPDGDARSFWSNDASSGIAQFTNLNFLSVGTMNAFGTYDSSAKYALPVWNGTASVESIYDVYQGLNQSVPQQVASACPEGSTSPPCDVTFLASDGTDQYTGSPITNPKAATLSLFDEDLKAKGDAQVLALNRANYQTAWNFLIPRAIAYSTGLINYFFRGRLDVQPDPNNPGGYLVINKSSDPMSNGTLTLYYDDASGNRYPVPGASWSNVSMAAAGNDPADEYSIQFSAPTDPAPATPGQYMLVFQGKIGSEDGVAGKLINVKNQYVYLAADTSDFCLWYNNCYGFINSYNSDFTLHATTIRPNDIFALAVYDGIEYTLEENYNDVTATCTYTVMRNGIEFTSSPACINHPTPGSVSIFDWAIGVNSKYAYLVKSVYSVDAQGYSSYLEEDAERYDHAGNYVSTIQNLPVQAVGSISTNDTRMCLTGYIDGFVTTAAMLTDLSGDPVVTLEEDPGAGIYGGDSYSCALTMDRAYVLVYPLEGDYTLDVYDLNGNKIASLDVSEAQQPGTYLTFWNVVATNSKIYIPIIIEVLNNPNDVITFTYKFIVYDRVITRNPAGAITSENFVREPDTTLPGLHINWEAYPAVDMKDVLGGPEN